jgi:histidine ammonia-lyase
MAACQAIEFLRPLKTTSVLERVHQLVRQQVAPLDKDRFLAPDLDKCSKLIENNMIWEVVLPEAMNSI